MVKIKPLEEIKKRYGEAATVIPERYGRAIERVTDWAEKATSEEAEALYAEKLRAAIEAKRRQKALKRVSNEEWKKRARELGKARIGEGVRKSVDKHAREFAPYHEALAGLELPPKTADPMANIDNRLKKVVETLVAKKKELKG